MMTIKLTIPQSVLLHTLVKVGPVATSRKNPSAVRLVELGYAEWLGNRKVKATEKGEKFIAGELA